MMHGGGKSDTSIVPEKPPNNAGGPAAEAVEGREVAKGNLRGQDTLRTQSRSGVPSLPGRVRHLVVITQGKNRMRNVASSVMWRGRRKLRSSKGGGEIVAT